MPNQTLGHLPDSSLVSNSFGFLRSRLDFDPYAGAAQVVITGVPFDMATSGRAGTRMGPQAIRAVSTHLAWEHCRFPWDFDVREKLQIVDCGDLVYEFGNTEDFKTRLQDHIFRLLQCRGRVPVTLGGDHFITLPILRAFNQAGVKPALLHFDAHSDTYEVDNCCDHGTMFHYARRDQLIDLAASVQVGIRTEYDPDFGFEVLTAPWCCEHSGSEIAERIRARIGDRPVYLSFDIDCLDPAFAPGTGTPVMGGLSSAQVLSVIRSLRGLNVVGCDLVEVSPPYDHAEITALAAATLVLDMLYLTACRGESRQF